MRRGREWAAVFALACAFALSTPGLGAEPRDPARADALFREGRDAMKARDYETACSRFGESQSLDPAPGTLLNLADCEEKLGRIVAAYRHVQSALAELPPRDDRARIAKERLTVLDRRAALVTLRVGPGVAAPFRVMRDAVEIAAAELGTATRTDPGSHTFVLALPDGRERRLAVVLREGEAKEIVLELGERPTEPPPPPPPTSLVSPTKSESAPPPPPPPAATHKSSTAAYVVGGIGVAGLIVAGVTGAVLAHRKSIVDRDCDRDARTCTTDEGVDAARTGKPLLPVFYGAAIVGVVGVSAGAVLLFTSSDEKRSIGVSAGPMTIDVRGRF